VAIGESSEAKYAKRELERVETDIRVVLVERWNICYKRESMDIDKKGVGSYP
jgi:hypothetical protein